MTIDTAQARQLGIEIVQYVSQGQFAKAILCLDPILQERTPFKKLEEIGKPLGLIPLKCSQPLFNQVAAGKTEGGWVVIASGLCRLLDGDFSEPFQLAR